jgi:hypothetical protein
VYSSSSIKSFTRARRFGIAGKLGSSEIAQFGEVSIREDETHRGRGLSRLTTPAQGIVWHLLDAAGIT